MNLPLLMGSMPTPPMAMSCESDYWVGFWLGVILTSIVGSLLMLGLHHICRR